MLRRIQPHIPGLLYTGFLLLVALAAMNNQNNLLFWVMGVMVAGLALSAVISTVMMRNVRVRRMDPQHGAVGEPLIVRYAVTNRSRWLPVFNVHVTERAGSWRNMMSPGSAWIMHIGPGETVHGETFYWPTRRGEVQFDAIRFWTAFPFGIIRKHRTISQPQHTLVYPQVYELRRNTLAAMTPPALVGTRASHRSGAGDEYYGMREYKPGDTLRHIAWKRTAKRDELVTVERTSPSPCRLRVILDLTTPTHMLQTASDGSAAARDLEERAIELAASLIHAADAAGYEVGLAIQGYGGPAIALRRSHWHVRKMLAALASVNLDAERLPRTSQPVRDAERAGLVVIAADRIQPLGGREAATYLSAKQFDTLTVRAIGWTASRAQSDSAAARRPVEAAA